MNQNVKLFIFLLLLFPIVVAAQDNDKSAFIGFTGGLMSYQGDLQPNSFSFKQSNGYGSVWLRQPITDRLSIKGGVGKGKIGAADALNRDYLKVRNLSFSSSVKEAILLLDFSLFNSTVRFTPFATGGLALFHFDPYSTDAGGEKVFLQPLGTEGQGLAAYPDRKKYKLTQVAIAFSGGLRYAVNDRLTISVEASQRKTFTDYLDDVSKSYASRDLLRTGNGDKAVELAFRGDELNPAATYPKEGEQRGTPTEMDWFYFAGFSIEVKLSALKNVFGDGGLPFFRKGRSAGTDWYNKRCPRVN